MSILDENNFDKFVIENSFTIDNENYKDEHSIKIRRDNELNIILNKQNHVLMGYLFLGLNVFFIILIWIRISLLIQDLFKLP